MPHPYSHVALPAVLPAQGGRKNGKRGKLGKAFGREGRKNAAHHALTARKMSRGAAEPRRRRTREGRCSKGLDFPRTPRLRVSARQIPAFLPSLSFPLFPAFPLFLPAFVAFMPMLAVEDVGNAEAFTPGTTRGHTALPPFLSRWVAMDRAAGWPALGGTPLASIPPTPPPLP
jgi:hypothetical protein